MLSPPRAKAEIYRMDSNIEIYSKQASRLKNSRCPVPERAMCAFLEDAVAAKGKMEEAMASRNRYWEQARNEYTSLNEQFKAAKEAFLALKDPTAELEEIKDEEAKYRDLAALEPKLAAAEAKQRSCGSAQRNPRPKPRPSPKSSKRFTMRFLP